MTDFSKQFKDTSDPKFSKYPRNTTFPDEYYDEKYFETYKAELKTNPPPKRKQIISKAMCKIFKKRMEAKQNTQKKLYVSK